jgi:hypothetical protein
VIGPSLGLIGPIGNGKKLTLAVLVGTFTGAAIATLILPANSPANPLALNFVAHYDMDAKAGTLLASAPPGALQKDLLKQLSIGEVHVPGVNGEIASRPLDYADRPIAALTKTDAGYSIAAAGARMVRIRIPTDAYATEISVNGASAKLGKAEGDYFIVDCVGRACDGGELRVTFSPPKDAAPPAKPPEWIVQGYWLGLPPEAQSITRARGDAALPIQLGDITITTKRQTF